MFYGYIHDTLHYCTARAGPVSVAAALDFIARLFTAGKLPATIRPRIAAINFWHKIHHWNNPTKDGFAWCRFICIWLCIICIHIYSSFLCFLASGGVQSITTYIKNFWLSISPNLTPFLQVFPWLLLTYFESMLTPSTARSFLDFIFMHALSCEFPCALCWSSRSPHSTFTHFYIRLVWLQICHIYIFHLILSILILLPQWHHWAFLLMSFNTWDDGPLMLFSNIFAFKLTLLPDYTCSCLCPNYIYSFSSRLDC